MELSTLIRLAKSEKTAFGDDWVLPTTRETIARWVGALAIDGSVVAGLTLTLQIQHARLNEFDGLTARMEYADGNRKWHLGRIDFCPAGPPPHHLNSDVRLMRRGFPPELSGSHSHLAEYNECLGIDAFKPERNLPAAREIDWPDSFANAISIIESSFCITGLWCGETLPWNPRML